MKYITHIKITKPIALMAIFVFLFQATFTFFQASHSMSVDGYTSVICTLAGTKTVFVSFDSDTPVNNCIECPTCIVLSHENSWLPSIGDDVLLSYNSMSDAIDSLPVASITNISFLSYFSRAPPV